MCKMCLDVENWPKLFQSYILCQTRYYHNKTITSPSVSTGAPSVSALRVSHPMYQLLPIPPRASSSAVGECKFLVNSSTAFNCRLLLLCCSPLPPCVTGLVSLDWCH